MSLNYAKLNQSYPKEPREILFKDMGGQWPSLITNPNYANTCAIRLSIAFNRSGNPIADSKKEAMTGSGDAIILKVKSFGDYLRLIIGDSDWGISKQPGQPIGNAIPAKTGIIVYHASWSDATGHFDLWTGSSFVGSGNFDDIRDGFDISMWWLA